MRGIGRGGSSRGIGGRSSRQGDPEPLGSWTIRLAGLLACLCLGAPAAAAASPLATSADFRDGVVLLELRPGVSPGQMRRIEQRAGGRGEAHRLGPRLGSTGGAHRGARRRVPLELQVAAGSVLSAVRLLRSSHLVAFAEPDYRMHASAVPDDPAFNLQWADQNTGQAIPTQESNESLGEPVAGTPGADDSAEQAWSVTTGSREVVIGEVDTGVDYEHPDLKANIWSNPGGIGGCGAGTHGYNAIAETCDPNDDDTSYGGHGTHVAGIMGAVGNNGIGVTGINWKTTILPVKWLSSAGSGETSDLVTALQWLLKAKEKGVKLRVVNDSATFEGPTGSEMLRTVIEELGRENILFVNAAGNTAENDDEVERYPCDYQLPNELCVTAVDDNDLLPPWANYGVKTVNLGAPGVSIYSTLREDKYGYLSGGSMASAQVSGAAALILSAEPTLSTTALREDILDNVDRLPSLEGKVSSGGRLDVCKAILGCASAPPALATGGASSLTQTSATLHATVNPNGGRIEECKFEYGTSSSYGSSVPCAFLPPGGRTTVEVSGSLGGLQAGTSYDYRILARNLAGTSSGTGQSLTTEAASPVHLPVTEPPPSEVPPGQSVLPSSETKTPTPAGLRLTHTSLSESPFGILPVEVSCPGSQSSCTVAVTLRAFTLIAASRGHRARRVTLILASGSLEIPGGRTGELKLHLSGVARQLLGRSHLLHATATVSARGAGGVLPTTTAAVAIQAPRK